MVDTCDEKRVSEVFFATAMAGIGRIGIGIESFFIEASLELTRLAAAGSNGSELSFNCSKLISEDNF